VKRGIAFIDVESQEMAENALKVNNHNLKGSMLQVFISKPPATQNADERTAFVNNLPSGCTEEELREHFGGSELIDEVRLIRDKQGHQKGFTYIQFYEASVCQDAIAKYNKTEMKGKVLAVEQTKSKD
jgi:RNA recognition motif-containing protein